MQFWQKHAEGVRSGEDASAAAAEDTASGSANDTASGTASNGSRFSSSRSRARRRNAQSQVIPSKCDMTLDNGLVGAYTMKTRLSSVLSTKTPALFMHDSKIVDIFCH
jgi:cobalamin biosynthesis Mg chelatase CobN